MGCLQYDPPPQRSHCARGRSVGKPLGPDADTCLGNRCGTYVAANDSLRSCLGSLRHGQEGTWVHVLHGDADDVRSRPLQKSRAFLITRPLSTLSFVSELLQLISQDLCCRLEPHLTPGDHLQAAHPYIQRTAGNDNRRTAQQGKASHTP